MVFFGQTVKGYWWFDTPDGEDIIKKTNFAAKLGFLLGAPTAIYDMSSRPQPNMYLHLFRATKIIVPMMGAGAMFTLTSQYLSRAFPELDKSIVYGLGGASVGTVVQACATKNKFLGGVTAFYGFVCGYLLRDFADSEEAFLFGTEYKEQRDNDWELFRFNLRQDATVNPPPPLVRPAIGGSSLAN